MRNENRASPILDEAALEWNNPTPLHRLRDYNTLEKFLPHRGEFVGPQKIPPAEARFETHLDRCNEFIEGLDRFSPKLNRRAGLGEKQENGGEDRGPLQTTQKTIHHRPRVPRISVHASSQAPRYSYGG